MGKKNETVVAGSGADWESLLASSRGLLLVDVYTRWAGPCEAMVGPIQKIKTGIQVNYEACSADRASLLPPPPGAL